MRDLDLDMTLQEIQHELTERSEIIRNTVDINQDLRSLKDANNFSKAILSQKRILAWKAKQHARKYYKLQPEEERRFYKEFYSNVFNPTMGMLGYSVKQVIWSIVYHNIRQQR